ncbi:hypothetical protein B4U80_13059 [Leptotrombidium deliense]|uniref:Uncharacterized protein n=1 Tax=Leptotrombidium deliense TaxID=299467 RepID=A0A443SDN1_9ACAR|nr:hypothetical protein B4U80_13059 [Leptotrombidium deliense]
MILYAILMVLFRLAVKGDRPLTHCSQYPNITIQSAVYSPGNGVVVFFKNWSYVLRSPKSIHNYPRLVAVNEIKLSTKSYPFNAMFTFVNRSNQIYQWYGLKQVKGNESYRTDYFILDSLYNPKYDTKNVVVGDNDFAFVNFNQERHQIGVFAALRLPAVNDYYSGIFFRNFGTNKLANKFVVSGSVQVAADALEIGDYTRLNAIDIFWNNTNNDLVGYKSLGTIFEYFVSNYSFLSLVGKSPHFDNQVLIGCPPTLCIYVEFDAALASKHDGTIYLFFDRHYWSTKHLRQHYKNLEAKYINRTMTLGLERKNELLTAAFSYGKRSFLFTEEETVWISDFNFTSFYIQESKTVLPGLKIRTGSVDAMFTQNDLLFIIKGDGYYVYDLQHKRMSEEFLNRDYLQAINYPLSMADFRGIPESIDAAFSHNNNLYFFCGSFMYRLTGANNKYDLTVRLIQEEFANCSNYDYQHSTFYKSFTDFQKRLLKFQPKSYKGKPSFSLSNLLFVFLVVLVAVGVVILLCLVVTNVYDTIVQRQRTPQTLKQQSIRKKKVKIISNK